MLERFSGVVAKREKAPKTDAGGPANRRSAGVSLDVLTLIGVTLALGAIVGGNWLEGGEVAALMQATAFVIVMGGTLGAVLIQTPPRDFTLALSRLSWVFLPPAYPRSALLEKMLGWSRIARRDGLLALEKEVQRETHPLTQKGLQLLVDGWEPEDLRKVMEVEIDKALAVETRAARVYEAMGGYSPTIGILGAVLGLIHVMNNLSDPSQLGSGIAVAFVATIYGVGFANLLFLPISNKLKAISMEQVAYHEMVIEAMTMIADGDNPSVILNTLEGYLD